MNDRTGIRHKTAPDVYPDIPEFGKREMQVSRPGVVVPLVSRFKANHRRDPERSRFQHEPERPDLATTELRTWMTET